MQGPTKLYNMTNIIDYSNLIQIMRYVLVALVGIIYSESMYFEVYFH